MGKKIRNFIGFFVVLLLFTGCSSVELNVKEENVKVEYGKEISVKAEDYLLNDKDVLSKVEVSSDIVNEEGKDYPAIGEYTLTFNYKEQEIEVKVSVADTTNPVFVDFKDTVETYQNCEVDFSVLYSAEDLCGVTLSYDDTKVDYTTGGTYTATVTATDGSGNSETKEVSVHVIAVSLQLDKTFASVYTGETVPLVATINIPEAKAVFTSSDETVATVDENGLVTGVKTGKAIITAEVNGIKAECEVSVSEKTNTSKPAGSTNKNPVTNTTTSKPPTNTGTTNNNSTTNNSSTDNVSEQRIAYAIEDTYVYLINDSNEDNICGTLLKGQGVTVLGRGSSKTECNLGYNDEGEWYWVNFGKYYGDTGFIPAKYITEIGNGEIVKGEILPHTVKEAFELINTERVKLGLEPAVWDAECERIALIRGEEIAPYVIPDHDGFLKFQNENRKLCECLAWGYSTAEDVVSGWKNSPGHWNILMDPDYTKLVVVRVNNKWVAVNSR